MELNWLSDPVKKEGTWALRALRAEKVARVRVRRGGISLWEQRTEGTSSSDPNSEEAGPGLLASAGHCASLLIAQPYPPHCQLHKSSPTSHPWAPRAAPQLLSQERKCQEEAQRHRESQRLIGLHWEVQTLSHRQWEASRERELIGDEGTHGCARSPRRALWGLPQTSWPGPGIQTEEAGVEMRKGVNLRCVS